MARRYRKARKVVRLSDQVPPLPPEQAPAAPVAGPAWHILILTNEAGSHLYTTMARDVAARVHESRTPVVDSYTRTHGLTRLVLTETFGCRHTAFARMKRIRAWPVTERRRLIEAQNPDWRDLCEDPLLWDRGARREAPRA